MSEISKEKIKLTTREILLTFCDGINLIQDVFGYKWQRKEAREYWKWRELDKISFNDNIRRLERQGYIKKFVGNYKKKIILTKIGKEKALKYIFSDSKIKTPKIWNGKWHVIIFDIPEDKKNLRNIVRHHLKKWQFYQLQMSVFVHPFECQKEILGLKYIYNLGNYLRYIVAENIYDMEDLIKYFLDRKVLNKDSFKDK